MKLARLFVTAVSAINVEQMKAQDMDSISPADGAGMIKCFLQFEKDVNVCIENATADPACQEDGPDVDWYKCNKDFVSCFMRAFADFGPNCLEPNLP